MDKEAKKILAKHGCLYMKDDYKALFEELEAYYKPTEVVKNNAVLPVVMPRLTIQGIEFNKFDKDNETEIVVPSHGYDDDNHIWLTADELKQIGKFYFNEA